MTAEATAQAWVGTFGGVWHVLGRRVVAAVLVTSSVVGAIGFGGVADAQTDPVSADPSRYIVTLDPQAVSPWLTRMGGDFGEALRVATVKSRVIAGAQGDVLYDYGDLPYVALETHDPEALAGLDGVVAVQPDVVVRRQLDLTLPVIEATDSHLDGLLAGTRLDGSGWAVAVIDDGLDIGHPWFTGRVVAEGCYTSDGSCPGGVTSSVAPGSSAHGSTTTTHGTHVAGIVLGDPSTGTGRGVARAASLVSIRVFDLNGNARQSTIDAALQQVIGLASQLPSTHNVSLAAVNLSLGTDSAFGEPCDGLFASTTKNLVDSLRGLGVVTTVATGNREFVNGISWPACLSNVVPVTATDNVDNVANFSNVSEQVKAAGLAAPGVGVRSAGRRSLFPSGQTALSGTSMAAPHAAGAVALLRQALGAGPSAADIVQKLRTSSTTVNDVQVTAIPRLSVSDGVQAALPMGVNVTVNDNTVGDLIAVASTPVEVSFVPTSGVQGSAFATTFTTSPSGTFRVLGLAPGNWNVSVSAANYRPPVDNLITVTDGAMTTLPATLQAPSGSVGGVVSVSGQPTSATLRFFPTGANTWPIYSTTSALAPDGAFTVPVVRAGTWELEARVGFSVSPRRNVTVNDQTTTSVGTVELTLPTATVEVTLSDGLTGASLTTSAVTLAFDPTGDFAGRGPFITVAQPNSVGKAAVSGVALGSWNLTVSVSGYASKVRDFEAAVAEGLVDVPTVLEPQPGAVAGVVTLIGDEAINTLGTLVRRQSQDSRRVQLTFDPAGVTAGRMRQVRTVTVEGSGSFRAENLLPGAWTLTPSSFGFRIATNNSVQVQILPGQETPDLQLVLNPVVELSSATPISPSSAPAANSTNVTLTGIHMNMVTGVTISTQTLTTRRTPVSSTTSQLTFVVPPGSGLATVSLDSALGVVNSTTFTYTAPPAPSAPAPAPAPGGGGGGGGGGGTSSDPPPATATIAAPSQPGGAVTVDVEVQGGVLGLAFAGVSGAGEVVVQQRSGPPTSGTSGLRLLDRHVDISASGVNFQQVELCVPYAADDPETLGVDPSAMRLLHFVGDLGRRDITTRVDTARRLVCGITDSFSPFAIGSPATERIAGADRYATAVELSTTFFPAGARTVYLASGTGFADALAAGAAAAQAGGPVLLTTPSSLPARVRAELVRLAPTQVVIVGGAAAVSPAVDAAVRGALPTAAVVRLQGNDRYATAVEVSKRAFPNGAATVYLATGLSFPDALAGAAAAGRDGAPVLLVPGTRIPAVVRAELERLRPGRVVLLGGTTALSTAVATAVGIAVPAATVTRLQGADRYATAASVAATFTAGSTVFIATGRTFPDALAGAAIAGLQRGPVVVVPDGALPASLRTALARLRPTRMVVLGGVGALSSAVELQAASYLP